MTIVEFLLARIAEDEAVASEAAKWYGGRLWWSDGSTLYEKGDGSPLADVIADPSAPYLSFATRFQAGRVLAECEAKRRIVEDNARMYPPGAPVPPALHLKRLAAIYADHPDYREEWRP